MEARVEPLDELEGRPSVIIAKINELAEQFNNHFHYSGDEGLQVITTVPHIGEAIKLENEVAE